MKYKILFILVLSIFLISFISAISCTPDEITQNASLGETPQQTIICEETSDYLFTISTFGDFFDINESIIEPLTSGNNKTAISVDFLSTAEEGSHSGFIFFKNTTEGFNYPVQVSLYVEGEDITDPTDCHLNPTLVTYTQTVQQGTEFELPKVTFNPKNCEGTFSIDSPYISGGVTTSEGQKPVYIKSSSSTEIILGVNTKGLSSAPYKSTLTLSAFGQTFTDVSTINIIVIGGTNPDTDFDITKIPTCSLTNNILNTNHTYSLVCTSIIPGVSIHPIIDSEYIKGLGPGSDMTSTNFVWEFQPKKLGNTIIEAEFRYLDLPVGDPFSQEVKIQATSGQAPGTSLGLVFTPGLDKALPNEEVIIQLVDNKSSSLVDNPEIYVDAVKLFPLNTSEKSFPFKFELGEDYEIRGKSPGYNDLVKTVNLTSQQIEITITPDQEFYDVNDVINITANVENATILLDNEIIESPYTIAKSGTLLIEAKKENYLIGTKNITVKSTVSYTTMSPELDKWKKGKTILMYLTENVSWSVEYEESYNEEGNTYYKDPVQIASGETQEVEFEIDSYGRYNLKESDNIIVSKIIEKKGLWTLLGKNWIWIIVVVVVVLIIYLVFFKGKKGEEGFQFVGQAPTGGE